MRKFIALAVNLLLLVTITFINVSAQNKNVEVKTGLVTLYAKDPLAQTFCFKDGKYGTVLQENEVRNRCSDISFNSYINNSFSVGIEGARKGRIINLGTADELQQRYKYKETIGKGQGFASIQFQNGKVYILKERNRRQPNKLQELSEANELFKNDGKSNDNISAKLGEIYLLRLKDGYEKGFEKIVKFIVTDYQPDKLVTIRWQVILDMEDNNKGK